MCCLGYSPRVCSPGSSWAQVQWVREKWAGQRGCGTTMVVSVPCGCCSASILEIGGGQAGPLQGTLDHSPGCRDEEMDKGVCLKAGAWWVSPGDTPALKEVGPSSSGWRRTLGLVFSARRQGGTQSPRAVRTFITTMPSDSHELRVSLCHQSLSLPARAWGERSVLSVSIDLESRP